MDKRAILAIGVSCAALVACSSSSSTGTTSDSGPTPSGGTDYCANPPPNSAPTINDQYSSSPMPPSGTATGGTIVSGTYYMTAITNYGSSGSNTHQNTLVLDAAGTWGDSEVNGGKVKPAIGGTFTLSGHLLTQVLKCPTPASASVEFTVAGNTITFYNYDAKSVSVFTKQ